MNTEIYLDANATSPVLLAAIAAAAMAMREGFGNPSSTHATGLRAKELLDAVRARACALLGVGAGRLCFTSGATEGIQSAVLSALCAVRERRLRGEYAGELLVYGATEHKAVPESLAHWNRLLGTGLELVALPVDQDGRHDLALLGQLAPRAAMVCTMAANNETGVVSDLDGIGAVLGAAAGPALWLVDSVQALGKMALSLAATRIDYAPFSGHKLHAPKGIGMLYVRAGAPYTALMCGGGQEGGLRAGTENMAGIAALGAVLEALGDGATFRSHSQLSQFRERLAGALRAALPGVVFNAPFAGALPTTLNFSVPGLASKELLDLFDAAGLRASGGSACSSAKAAPSYVLEAMHLPHWQCAAAVRLSFGLMADQGFIDAACARIARCGAALRASAPGASAMPVEPPDGIMQLGVDGACTWLVLDAASRSCIVIDALEPLASRIADFIGGHQYQVRAVLDTCGHVAHASGAPGRAALLALLEGSGDGAAGHDAPGWPGISQTLGLGARMLVRVARQDGAIYLLGQRARDGVLAPADVDFAFIGPAVPPQLASLVGPGTILCMSNDGDELPCTTLRARAAPPGAVQRTLDAAALSAFMLAHADAVLVDVREPYEHLASRCGSLQGRLTHSVPLSRLADHLPGWLGAVPRPLVFFCRSGARSARAAACLHRLGYENAWHVAGVLEFEGAPEELAVAA
ncbi:aminotransferase class V-fold PLP-dependent enzyme [Massilia sp. TWP1-3-3]|uniref:aminotransferase class V-fold PLP-dependent enzyme n=1 Tax=Massilia sp. TWP1-3-3 TaxID=2804573 RepID=UPI003CE9075D